MSEQPMSLDFGHLVEGVVEQDPMTDQYVVRTVDAQGKAVTFDPNRALGQYLGQEIRIVIVSFDTLEKIQDIVVPEGEGSVAGELTLPLKGLDS